MQWLFERVHEGFHRPETALYRQVHAVVWVLIVLSIALFIQEMLTGRAGAFGMLLDVTDTVVLWAFALELILRLGSHRPPELAFYRQGIPGELRVHLLGRLRYLLTPAMLIDLLTVVAVLPELRGLRALRLLRLLRTRRFFRYSNPLDGLMRAFTENSLLLGFGFSVFAITAIMGGISITLIERGENPGIQHLGDGMWWAMVTLTTVGFGDITPVTGVGKVVGGILMLSGMVILALFAGIVGQTLMSSVLTIRMEQFRMRSTVDHVVLCGYDVGSQMILDTLASELDLRNQAVVVFGPGDRPVELPPEFHFISGDPTRESELEKVRVRYASAVILLGSRKLEPQYSDAATILATFTIRRFLKNRPLRQERARPLYIVCEILDTENVEHARVAGADEVIETTRIGFSLVAHAVRYHGTASLLGDLAYSQGHNLYVGGVPEGIELPVPWGELTARLKQESNILLIGLRDDARGEDRVNPSLEYPVGKHAQLLYMSDSEKLPPV